MAKPVTHEQKLPRVAAVSSVRRVAKRHSADDTLDVRAARAALSPAGRAELDAPYRLGAVIDLMRRFQRSTAIASDAPRRVITNRKKA